jgi:prepilin-type N-terminal cleavage/methylation domain-containing protein
MSRAIRLPQASPGGSLGRRRELRAARGYTVIEILLSLTVLAIGAAAVMSMQKAAVQGNVDARKTDMANSIAREWMDRVRRDSTQWTVSTPASGADGGGGSSNFATASLLNHVDGKWRLPIDYIGNTPPISPGFDFLGNDIAPQSALTAAVFCVHVKETWLVSNPAAPQDNLLRVDLRVVWSRGIDVNNSVASPCDSTVSAEENPNPLLYQTLYMTTAVRENGLP